MDRRQFNAGLAAATVGLVASRLDAVAPVRRPRLYSCVGATITGYDVDVDGATLTRGASLALPSAVQYAWVHPTGRYLYASTSDATPGAPGPSGHIHRLCAMAIGADGGLSLHGAPAVLPQRPVHNSVDATGRYALVAYSSPANATVHHVAVDGTLGAEVEEPAGLDYGIFPHQVRTTPSNRAVALVTRGNDGGANHPEDPGAIVLFRFDRGRLAPLQKVVAGDHGGLGYGPRHLDFHPTRPWVYVALERENQLHMHRVAADDRFSPQPVFTCPTTGRDQGGPRQTLAGAIHVHPAGHTVYVSNRANRTVESGGRRVFAGGVNSIAVFSIDPRTGRPTLVQEVDPQGYYVRTFTIDPTGRLMVAGITVGMDVADGDGVRHVPAGMSVFRIAADGRLSFVRKYDQPADERGEQWWVGMAPAAR